MEGDVMKILNYGSLNIDHYYKVDDIVKPGETITVNAVFKQKGGKGLNRSVAMSRAGSDNVYHAGAIGQGGKFLLDFLEENKVNTDLVTYFEDEISGHAIIQLDQHGENCILVYGGTNKIISKNMIDDILEHFEAGDILVVENETINIPYIIRKAREKSMYIYFNASPIDEVITKELIGNVDCLIINEHEGAAITGAKHIDTILKRLQKEYPELEVILTLGAHGSIYAYKSQRIQQDAIKTKPVDTTGAGDCFTGYFISSRAQGRTVSDSLKIASYASSLTIKKEGAADAIPMQDEVREYMKFENTDI